MKHWLNAPEIPCMFITSTVRGWTPIFERPEIRDVVAASLIDDHRFYGALLHAFAVMQHHFHTISIMPPGKTSSWFGARLKSNAAKRVLPLLTDREARMLWEAPEDDGRVMWKRSIRGVPITSHDVRVTKVNYVHMNPVRAGLCALPAEYRWSSARFREAGIYDAELGLDLDALLQKFGDPPSLRADWLTSPPPGEMEATNHRRYL